MSQPARNGWAVAGSVFAATLLVVTGIFQAIMGIIGIVRHTFYLVTRNYLFDLNTTSWGWIHLVIGALMVVVGLFLFAGASWAAVTAIALAALSAVNNFFFLPHYPFWSILVIALDVFVIWSLATMINNRAGSGPDRWAPEQTVTAGGRWPQSNVGTGRHATADAPDPTVRPTRADQPPPGR
ncbi:DUF7144 family membrane protein [Actinocatenispora rupis]|nr:hypothetical protein [Actinocatenispora rupis]